MEQEEKKIAKLHKAIIKTSHLHRRQCHLAFYEVGLSEGQPKILNLLAFHNGCGQKDLARLCHVEPATITSILNGMEKAGLIYRKQNEKDKRILNVYLTEEGILKQKQVKDIFAYVDEVCFKGFSEEEKEKAISLIARIATNLEKKGKIHA